MIELSRIAVRSSAARGTDADRGASRLELWTQASGLATALRTAPGAFKGPDDE